MADRSSIEWTEATWNPVRGCTKVSEGCRHCYAETFAERWRGIPGHPYESGFDLRTVPEVLDLPLRWKRPRMIFVNSMSDLFHEEVPYGFIQAVFDVMKRAPHHRFQVLTKRAKRVAELSAALPWPPNVWLGVSIEDLANVQACAPSEPLQTESIPFFCIGKRKDLLVDDGSFCEKFNGSGSGSQ